MTIVHSKMLLPCILIMMCLIAALVLLLYLLVSRIAFNWPAEKVRNELETAFDEPYSVEPSIKDDA